jgi:membrane fusion protein, multidrug efflux system
MSHTSTPLSRRRLGFGAGIAVAVAVALWCLLGGRGTVHTENAYVKADIISLATEVAGRITQVNVRTNQRVQRGQLLAQLDDTPYRLAVAEAEAHLAQVHNHILARRADYAEAQAELEQAREDADYYQRKLARNEKLGPVAVSEAQLDESRQQLATARAQIAINQQKLSRLNAELGGNPDVPPEQQADVRVAQAQLDNARYKLSRTSIVAPVDGIIANTVPQTGEMAAAGFTLLSMISAEAVWVEANLKETQLAAVRPGQQAVVTVDAYPGQQWLAQVESLSPASGSEFALIPAQNASGNWVKVVQRIPVHLRLLSSEGEQILRAGMSAQVSITVAKNSIAIAADQSLDQGGHVVTGQ